MPVATAFVSPPLGYSIPYLTPHAVSVSLPTWRDNVGYEEGDKRVVDAMQTGYPRFFVHRSIQKLAGLADKQFANQPGDRCFLFPTLRIASRAVAFLTSREPSIDAYYKAWTIPSPVDALDITTIYAVFTSAEHFAVQKQFWQHTGDGISSRLAEHCLHLIGQGQDCHDTGSSNPRLAESPTSPSCVRSLSSKGFSRNKHYSKKSSQALEAIMGSTASTSKTTEDTTANPSSSTASAAADSTTMNPFGEDLNTYIEERYARNLSASQAPLAKTAMRRRIAGVLRERSNSLSQSPPSAGHPAVSADGDSLVKGRGPDTELSPRSPSLDMLKAASATNADLHDSSRGVSGLTEDDVFLYPTGMSAIFHSFMSILGVSENAATVQVKASPPVVGKSVCFGFPYTDTLKILQKWGPGCHFFGLGLDSDLDDLEKLLSSCRDRHLANPDSTDPDDKPILSLFCEFPSNPLLRCPNLQKLKHLADEYGFYIVIDETVGGFVNVECLPFANIVVSSLTKVFSGDSNVMGGSLTVNPIANNHEALKQAVIADWEDTYYASDAIFMERNSRDFRPRVARINRNTEAVCEFLQARAADQGSSTVPQTQGALSKRALKKVYYPKYITPENYRARMRRGTSTSNDTTADDAAAGYGGLFSVTFTSLAASRAFFDALKCCKGPSLGTNFTLACPYTVLAHYLELDWAAEWEVEEGLVRVSVGLEDEKVLLQWFGEALDAAEAADAVLA